MKLEDCFFYNEKTEHFFGENSMYCRKCKGIHESLGKSEIYFAPLILSIVLNRGKNLDFQENIIFGTELNIEKFIHCKEKEKEGKYYLISMVVNIGKTNIYGPYIAYCRMDQNSKWYCYNDEIVSECENIDDIIKNCTPHILFYHKY